MATLSDVLKNELLIQYTKNAINEWESQPMMLETYFPRQSLPTLDIRMFKGAYYQDVIAHVHSFDTLTEPASRDNFDTTMAEMMLIKRKFRVGEKEAIQLRTAGSNEMVNFIRNNIYNDVERLINSIRARFELMRAEALTTGKNRIKENGVDVTLDYQMPKNHFIDFEFTDPSKNPLTQIEAAMDLAEEDGNVRPERILTSRHVVKLLAQHPLMKKAILGTESERYISDDDLNDFFVSKGFPSVNVYERTYLDEKPNGKREKHRYIPENSFILLPGDAVGNTFNGPTAEQLELAGTPGINVTSNDWITTTEWKEVDSPAHNVKAVATGLVTFPYAETVISGTVK